MTEFLRWLTLTANAYTPTAVPQAGQLKIEDFIDRSLISELESEGLIAKIYERR